MHNLWLLSIRCGHVPSLKIKVGNDFQCGILLWICQSVNYLVDTGTVIKLPFRQRLKGNINNE